MTEEYFAKGKRGIIFIEERDGKKIAIKRKNPESEAVARIENEARFMKLLNKHYIGPNFIESGADYVCYEFVEGDLILDFIEKSGKEEIMKALLDVLCQCKTLDELKINKEEMHHPIKHIIITKDRAVMIDFERCHHVRKPKNVTQFCQFLRSPKLIKTLTDKGISIDKDDIKRNALEYSKDDKKFEDIVKLVS